MTDPNAREAAEAEAAILSRLIRERAKPRARVTKGERVRDWYDRWLAAREERGISTTADRSHLRTHILEEIGDVVMVDLRPSDLERVVRRLDRLVAAQELRWKSALNIWGTVTVAMDDATRGKLSELRCFSENPCSKVRGPDRGVETEKVHIFPAEFLRLMRGPAPLRRRRAYAIAIYMYLRPAELEALTWEDIDLARGQVTIQRSIDRESGVAGSPKAGRARAPHDIEPTLMPLLRAMHRKGATGAVIGRLADERDLADILRRDLMDAGVTRHELHVASDDPPREWMRMHDLRTTGVTWMAVRGDEPMVIMARAGHADLKTTLGYVSRSALVRRGYGAVFPALPKGLLARELAPELAPVRRNAGKSAEAHGNRTGRAPAIPREYSTDRNAHLRIVTPTDACNPAIPGGGADCGANWNPTRKTLVLRLLEAAKRGVHDERTEDIRRLAEAAIDALPTPRRRAAPSSLSRSASAK